MNLNSENTELLSLIPNVDVLEAALFVRTFLRKMLITVTYVNKKE